MKISQNFCCWCCLYLFTPDRAQGLLPNVLRDYSWVGFSKPDVVLGIKSQNVVLIYISLWLISKFWFSCLFLYLYSQRCVKVSQYKGFWMKKRYKRKCNVKTTPVSKNINYQDLLFQTLHLYLSLLQIFLQKQQQPPQSTFLSGRNSSTDYKVQEAELESTSFLFWSTLVRSTPLKPRFLFCVYFCFGSQSYHACSETIPDFVLKNDCRHAGVYVM